MKRKTKVHIVGWILIGILGLLKWQYPEETYIITSGFGGLIVVLFVSYLIFYPLIGNKKNK
ncbi:hypothetical protein DX933_15890 [Ornithinibacillus gellani]|uniref:hypothetical protein n=1 Tax=Ornithinibacillus gellani TaxID=2293253 RepID=UPI000F4A719D|nr:hypothetical protein [Ornithinibacillus gellani]TQS71159.1 hypothetical protein DX933_15890 [Ornithinibacillus gellani]